MTNKTALIIGSTGLIGNTLLHILLEQQDYNKVIALVRKPLGIKNSKLREIITDFTNLEDLLFDSYVDDVFSCLGTTIKKAQSKEAMRKIDVIYPLSVAKLTKKLGAKQFLFVSSLQANSKSPIFYSKIKGELEDEIQKIGYHSVAIFRPSLLLGDRQEFRLGEKSAELLFSIFPFIFKGPFKKYKAIHSKTVATAMFKVAQKDLTGVMIYPNEQIAEIGQKLS